MTETPENPSPSIQSLQDTLWQGTEPPLNVLCTLETLMLDSRTQRAVGLPVLASLLKHADPQAQAGAARMLAAWGAHAQVARPELTVLLDSEDLYLRGCAVLALSQQQDVDLIHPIQTLLAEHQLWGLFSASHALVFAQLPVNEFLDAFRAVFAAPAQFRPGSWSTGLGIALGARDPLQVLLEQMGHMHPSIQALHGEVLSLFHHPQWIEPAVTVLKKWPLDHSRAVSLLCEHLSGSDPQVLTRVLTGLADLQLPISPQATVRVLELAGHESLQVQLAAARALWFSAGERETSSRVALIQLDPDLSSRDSVLYSVWAPQMLELLAAQGAWDPFKLEALCAVYRFLFRTPSVGPGSTLVQAMWNITRDAHMVLPDILRILQQGHQVDGAMQCLWEMGKAALPALDVLQTCSNKDQMLLIFPEPFYDLEQLWKEEKVRLDLQALIRHLQNL